MKREEAHCYKTYAPVCLQTERLSEAVGGIKRKREEVRKRSLTHCRRYFFLKLEEEA